MKNISELDYCYGCGVCAIACPKKIISIKVNKDGFYTPIIKEFKLCTNCGKCLKVCSFIESGLSTNEGVRECYAGWSKDKRVHLTSSSGGVGYELSHLMIEEGYDVCAVRYNQNNNNAEHFLTNKLEDLSLFSGSKYIQSYTFYGFKEIDFNKKNLIIGTPCQIDSLKKLALLKHKEKNFIFVDIFCHGVPSLLVWNLYCKIVSKNIGNIQNASWRTKYFFDKTLDATSSLKIDWHDSYNILINGEKGFSQNGISDGNLFYKLFLGNFCMNPSCQKRCAYKYSSSSADIRIGDAWGRKYSHDHNGVSAVIVFTDNGRDFLNRLKTKCVLEPVPFDVIADGQLKENCSKPFMDQFVKYMVKKECKSLLIWRILFKILGFLYRIK